MAKPKTKKPVAKKPAAKKKPPATSKKTASAAKAAGNAGATSAPKYGARSDKGTPVAGYIAKLSGEQRAIADKLTAIIEKAAPELTSGLKWGMPVWSLGDQMLTYFRAQKNDTRWGLAWVDGVGLDDPDGLLQGTGKDGKHVKFTAAKDIDAARVTSWLKTVVASRK